MTLAASPVFAFNLSDVANAVSATQNQEQGAQVQAPAAQANLLNTLGSELKITPEQAIGGAGAMLGLARNNLSGDDYGQLTKAVPGLDLLSGASALGGLSGLGQLLGNGKTDSPLGNALGGEAEPQRPGHRVQGAGPGYRDDRAVCAVDPAIPGAAGDCRVVAAEPGNLWATPAPLAQPSV
jgi:hypothetical protein